MNERIKTLRDLNLTDVALRQLDQRRARQRDLLTTASRSLEEAKGRVQTIHKEMIDVQKQADEMNLDVKAAEEQAKKYEVQRNTAKSNKEYEVFTREIEEARQKSSAAEDEALARLERVDALSASEEEARQAVKQAESAVADAEAGIARLDAELKSEEEELKARREEVAAKVGSEDMAVYNQVRRIRPDTAMAIVASGVCRACFSKLRPQVVDQVDIGAELVRCPGCSRLLYMDEVQRGEE